MKIIKSTDKDVANEAFRVLSQGGLVIYPTETVYGIGVGALKEDAVKKLVSYKNRPFGKPFSIAVTDIKMAKKFAQLNPTAINLYKKFLPGPMTIISKGLGKVAPGIESENGTIGIRISSYPLVSEIIYKFGGPITATSANASYQKRPYKISDILENISDKQKKLIGLIIDAGELPKNEPSTVIDTTMDDPVILRQGEIKLSESKGITSRKPENTENLAKELWQKYEPNSGERAIVFALQGEMGTGKTVFTKGLARAMGIKETVTSPTYSLENEYDSGEVKLYHYDAWRMTESNELKTLGFDRLIKNKSVVSIEWAERVVDIIREFDDEAIVVWVRIEYTKKENERYITWGVTQ